MLRVFNVCVFEEEHVYYKLCYDLENRLGGGGTYGGESRGQKRRNMNVEYLISYLELGWVEGERRMGKGGKEKGEREEEE
jgi:hypothetical protein